MLNTAFIEGLNGTMRQRLASLTRKCRHAARRLEALETGMYPASMHVQLLLAAPRVEQADASCQPDDTSHGRWAHGSYLERVRALEPADRARALARAQATRATKETDRTNWSFGQTP